MEDEVDRGVAGQKWVGKSLLTHKAMLRDPQVPPNSSGNFLILSRGLQEEPIRKRLQSIQVCGAKLKALGMKVCENRDLVMKFVH